MGVISIGSKVFLGGRYLQDEDQALVPEWVKIFGWVMLTLFMPTLIFCAVSGQLLPLYLMACNEALGAVLGVFMFIRSSDGFLSCVPATRIPDIPSGTSSHRLKRAA
jgi:hypothetical protein